MHGLSETISLITGDQFKKATEEYLNAHAASKKLSSYLNRDFEVPYSSEDKSQTFYKYYERIHSQLNLVMGFKLFTEKKCWEDLIEYLLSYFVSEIGLNLKLKMFQKN